MAIRLGLLFFFSGLSCAALYLLYRLWAAKRSAARLIWRGRSDPLSTELMRLVSQAIDTHLLLQAGGNGLSGLDVRFRESQDSYRTLGDLLGQLEKNLAATRFADLNQFIKGVFQLQATLGIPFADLGKTLAILEERLKNDSSFTNPVARIEIVAPGTMVDPKKMAPVTAGTIVKQPLGVVALDGNGKVLGKARVICQ